MNFCSDEKRCPQGNCIGCKNGQLWCRDPRCSPYCPEAACIMDVEHRNVVNLTMTLILSCLVVILFIIWVFYGPSFYKTSNEL